MNVDSSSRLWAWLGHSPLSTHAAGCEVADQLGDVGVLLIHGSDDQILPYQASQLVQTLCDGEFVLTREANHLLQPGGDQLRGRVLTWIGSQFGLKPQSERDTLATQAPWSTSIRAVKSPGIFVAGAKTPNGALFLHP